MGTREFDPQRVCFVTDHSAPGFHTPRSQAANAFLFKVVTGAGTPTPGNTNLGHDHGNGRLTEEMNAGPRWRTEGRGAGGRPGAALNGFQPVIVKFSLGMEPVCAFFLTQSLGAIRQGTAVPTHAQTKGVHCFRGAAPRTKRVFTLQQRSWAKREISRSWGIFSAGSLANGGEVQTRLFFAHQQINWL